MPKGLQGFQKGHPPYKSSFKKGEGSGLYGSRHPQWKGGKIQQKCTRCFQTFEAWKSRGRKYCSPNCFLKDLHKKIKNGVWKSCRECSKDIYVRNYQIEKKMFCSNPCKILWLTRENTGKKRWKTSGERNWNWKGGVTPERTKIYFSEAYRNWVKSVYKRDNYTCQKCGDNSGNNLKPHHKESFADYPKLRLKVSNGITLCENCHVYFHSKYGTHHNNREQLKEFLNEKQEAIITSRGRQIVVSEVFKTSV